jgi:predicted RND superfamily exporter protein
VIRLALLSWERKYLCLLLVIGLTLAAVPLAQRVRLDLGVESLYPTAGLAVTEYEKARATFGTDEVAAIYAEDAQLFTPERLAELGWTYYAIGRGASVSPVV